MTASSERSSNLFTILSSQFFFGMQSESVKTMIFPFAALIPLFLVNAGKDITIFGDGSQTRSFCYVSDMVDGLIRLMDKEKLTGPVNLGNPGEFSILECAKLIVKLTGSSSGIIPKRLPKDDPKQRRPDIALARKELGWNPGIKFEEGLKDAIAFFKSLKIEEA